MSLVGQAILSKAGHEIKHITIGLARIWKRLELWSTWGQHVGRRRSSWPSVGVIGQRQATGGYFEQLMGLLYEHLTAGQAASKSSVFSPTGGEVVVVSRLRLAKDYSQQSADKGALFLFCIAGRKGSACRRPG